MKLLILLIVVTSAQAASVNKLQNDPSQTIQTQTIQTQTIQTQTIQTRRCGVNSRPKRFVTVNKWETPPLTEMNETVITWYLDLSNFERINTSLSSTIVKNILTTSMARWSKTALLYFEEVSEKNKANITFQFLEGDHNDGYSFDGPGNILAHAFYPSSSSLGGDVHFDIGEEWTLWDEKRGTSLFNVALHELGHSLGIGHSSQKNSVMYAWYNPESTHLKDDDLFAINQLYGVRPQHKFGPRTPVSTTTHTPVSTTTHTPVSTTTHTPVSTTTYTPVSTTTHTPKTTRKFYLSKIKKILIQNSKVFVYPKSATFSL
jgi:hypothetical protein